MQEPRNILRTIQSSGSFDDTVYHPEHYIKLPCGYRAVINDEETEPFVFQPTPEGLEMLIGDFTSRTGRTFKLLNQAGVVDNGLLRRFQHAKTAIDAAVHEGIEPVAMILSYGQMHAYPVLLVRKGLEKHLIVFDSTSGGMISEYYSVAKAFPEYKVMLNRGTRQADTQSCITDAFEILCRALQIEGVGKLVEGGLEKGKPVEGKLVEGKLVDSEAKKDPVQSKPPTRGGPPRRFSASIKPGNFHLFNMPEELCFTAQRKEFLLKNNIDLDKKFRQDGESTTLNRELTRHCEISQHDAIPLEGIKRKPTVLKINHYLYEASVRHKKIIDRVLFENNEPFAELL